MTPILAGPAGRDSPHVEHQPSAQDWNDWLDIGAARAEDRPAPMEVLLRVLGGMPAWSHWWDRPHRGGDPLTHRAAIVDKTLVSACGYSQPYLSVLYGVAPVGDIAVRDSRRTYCARCQAVAPPRLTPAR